MLQMKSKRGDDKKTQHFVAKQSEIRRGCVQYVAKNRKKEVAFWD
jgi:hypothetical protein